ncbi:FxLD family lanthipeptide [Antribacter sp. KLBMP9083]|uniref:FxLD family lanthipeptide n=1 Tax=Antribacter soli TaxID=2910976 RepID=A0AA41U7I2_9MICO|nr:FxLD family lanthipeptide [Antribacter soli]MCF4122068.1 FxLD family lanthipeptide [Antribacter soli]
MVLPFRPTSRGSFSPLRGAPITPVAAPAFDLDIKIVESGPTVADLYRLTDDGCNATCASACTPSCTDNG